MLASLALAIALAFSTHAPTRTVCAPLPGAMLYTVVNLTAYPIAVSVSDDTGYDDQDEPIGVGASITYDAGDALPDSETYNVRIASGNALLGAFPVTLAPGTACVTYVGA